MACSHEALEHDDDRHGEGRGTGMISSSIFAREARIDPILASVWGRTGWCTPPVRPNGTTDLKFKFLRMVSTIGFIHINKDFWCYDGIFLISAS